MGRKKRYVQVGIGGRARFFYQAVAERFSDTSEITAFCDVNRTRLEYAQKKLIDDFGYHEVALYSANEFEK